MRLSIALTAVAFAGLSPAPLQAEPKPLAWDDAFSLKGAPAFVHVKASYTDRQGQPHTIEMWREGDKRLRRLTDGVLDLYVEKGSGGEYAFRVVDRRRKALIEVSRTNLYRIGVAADWPALAGMLARPVSASARLFKVSRPAEATPAGKCSWIRLEREKAPAQEICWSSAWRLPLKIRAEVPGKEPVITFQITALERKPLKAEVFSVDTSGLAVIRADEDISPSSD